MRSREIQQYQEFSMKEALKTATKAGLFTAVSNQIAKSTILRRIPGMASVREGMELKKRELYERTGRDESGRKLTKRELEDRELRRKDAGALASIWELLDQDWRNGVPVIIKGMESAAFAMMSGFGSNAAGGERFRPISREYGRSDNVTIASSGEGAYDIQDESSEKLQRREEAAEQERADDADQDRDQEKEEGFFTNLFSKTFGSRDRSKSGSLIDSLLGIVGPLLGIFGGGGGIVGMLSGIITPMLGALATAGTALIGVITPLLPFIVGAILVGAVGLSIKSWIDSWIEDQEKDVGLDTGMKNAYAYRDPNTGVTSLKTAEELGTTDEAIKSGARPTGLISPQKIVAEFRDGKLTGGLAKGIPQSKEAIAAYRASLGESVSLKTFGSVGIGLAGAMGLKPGETIPEELRESVFAVDSQMLEYTRSLNRDRDAISDSETLRNSYIDTWNRIRDQADALVNSIGPRYKIQPEFMASILKGISEQYKPFEGMFEYLAPGKSKLRDAKAEPTEKVGLLTDNPYDIRVPTKNGGFEQIIGDMMTTYDRERSNIGYKGTPTPKSLYIPEEAEPMRLQPPKKPSTIQAKPKTTGGFLTVSAENVGKASDGQASVIINNNSPTSNVMASASARTPTGIDLSPMFNGARLAAT
jgi:hypothetical protein